MMQLATVFNGLLDPAILFFFLGSVAGMLRSNLSIPEQITKFLSLYLLLAIGFKGGMALSKGGVDAQAAIALTLAVVLAFTVPVWSFCLLKRWLSGFDAAALAASYGSVSAVTFIAVNHYLEQQGSPASGVMTVALALMEAPAIIVALLIARFLRRKEQTAAQAPLNIGHFLKESLTDGAHLMLVGGLLIGWCSNDAGKTALDPFVSQIFKGMLCFFMLDMGLLVVERMREIGRPPAVLFGFGLIAPVVHAALGLGLAWICGLAYPEAVVMAVLAGSASYIAVPAVMRYSIPEANPSYYLGSALALTFPFNILVGIPLYAAAARWLYA